MINNHHALLKQIPLLLQSIHHHKPMQAPIEMYCLVVQTMRYGLMVWSPLIQTVLILPMYGVLATIPKGPGVEYHTHLIIRVTMK